MERHHLYWPRRKYRANRISWQFRQLPCNSVMISNAEHREIHAKDRETPGGMPDRETMLRKVNECKDCDRKCISFSQRIDHILGIIDDVLGGEDEKEG